MLAFVRHIQDIQIINKENEMDLKIDQKEIAGFVDTQIRLAMMEALGKDPEKLIQAIVRESLGIKKNMYDSQTIFQTSIAEMISNAAREVFREWLETKKQVVRDAIIKRLKNEESVFFDTLADNIIKGLANSFYVTATLKVK